MKRYDIAFRADSITALFTDIRDSLLYFVLAIDTLHMQNCVSAATQVVEEYVPPDEDSAFEKRAYRDAGRAGTVPVGDNVINLSVAPNPFRNTTISFTVPPEDGDAQVEVLVFDFVGHDVKALSREPMLAGRHSLEFHAEGLQTGAYVIAVHTLTHMQSKMVTVVK